MHLWVRECEVSRFWTLRLPSPEQAPKHPKPMARPARPARCAPQNGTWLLNIGVVGGVLLGGVVCGSGVGCHRSARIGGWGWAQRRRPSVAARRSVLTHELGGVVGSGVGTSAGRGVGTEHRARRRGWSRRGWFCSRPRRGRPRRDRALSVARRGGIAPSSPPRDARAPGDGPVPSRRRSSRRRRRPESARAPGDGPVPSRRRSSLLGPPACVSRPPLTHGAPLCVTTSRRPLSS